MRRAIFLGQHFVRVEFSLSPPPSDLSLAMAARPCATGPGRPGAVGAALAL